MQILAALVNWMSALESLFTEGFLSSLKITTIYDGRQRMLTKNTWQDFFANNIKY